MPLLLRQRLVGCSRVALFLVFLFVHVMALTLLGADDSQFIHPAWTCLLKRTMPTDVSSRMPNSQGSEHIQAQAAPSPTSISHAAQAPNHDLCPSSLKPLSNMAANDDSSSEQIRNLTTSHQELNHFSPWTLLVPTSVTSLLLLLRPHEWLRYLCSCFLLSVGH